MAQTFTDLEIVVIDDGSTDNTRKQLERYGECIRYIYQENRGVSSARNEGIRDSSGEYLAFLDADDLWLPRKLECQVPILDASPDVGLVYCWAYYTDETGNKTLLHAQSLFKSFEAGSKMFEKLLFQNFITTATVLLRRQCLETVGLFDKSLTYSEDWDLWVRVSMKYQIAVVPEALACYRLYEQGPLEKYKDQNVLVPIVKRACSSLPKYGYGDRKLRGKAVSNAYWQSAIRHFSLGRTGLARSNLLRALWYDFNLANKDSTLTLLTEFFLGEKLSDFFRHFRRFVFRRPSRRI